MFINVVKATGYGIDYIRRLPIKDFETLLSTINEK